MATPPYLSGTDEIEPQDLIAVWSSRNRDTRRVSAAQFSDSIADRIENDLDIAVASANASADIAQAAADNLSADLSNKANKSDLAATYGAGLVGTTSGTVQQSLDGKVSSAVLASPSGASGVGVSYLTSGTGVTLPAYGLDFFVRSSPIDVRVALPANYDLTGSTNYTTQIQKILDYFRDFGGGTLLLPAKLSLLIGGLQVYTGTEIVAPDWSSEFIVSPDGYGWGISINQLNGGTTSVEDNQRNIRFSGFSIRGQALVPTFSEHQHLLNLNAVSDLLIENVRVKGHRGDGIYLGSSNTNGLERHNERIVVDRCTIDGINAENRNGISIIDGSQVVISKSRILNTSKVGMPGAIDMEPDANTFARIRDITVEDFFISGGKGAGIASLLGPNASLTTPTNNIRILRGTVVNKEFGFVYQRNTAAPTVVPRDGVTYSDIEVKNCETPFLFDSVVDGTLRNVKFSDCTKQAQLGYIYGNRDILLDNVTMERCGTAETNGLRVRTIDSLAINNCLFDDCGRTDVASGRAIYFADGDGRVSAGRNISITGTTIRATTGKTTYPIGVDAGTFTLNNGSCRFVNNAVMAGNNDFVVPGRSGLASAPTTGTWVAGNEVFASPSVLAVSGIKGWTVTTGGVDAAVKWEPLLFHPFRRLITRNYQLTEDFNAGLYDIFSINIQAGQALTYNAPTGGTIGQEITIRVRNGSGIAMGVITWNAAFKMSGWTNPAIGKSRSVTFYYDGTNWIEISQTLADVAN